MNAPRSLATSVLAGLAIAAPARAQWTDEHRVYQIHRAGFYDVDHTSPTGYQDSSVFDINSSGWTTGASARYRADGTSAGRDIWLFDGEGTRPIGPSGVGYVSATGYRTSNPQFLNDAGQVAGTCNRYDAMGNSIGEATWVFDGTTSFEVGFTGGIYTSEHGAGINYLDAFNSAGQAAGRSLRYAPDSLLGHDAWIWTGNSLRQVGFTTAPYTGASGIRESQVTELNDAGVALGFSKRYYTGSSAQAGQDTWIVNGQITQRIGFIGTGYETDEGYRHSTATHLNAAGDVLGHSARYSGGLQTGQDAWLFDGLTTRVLGLTGPDYVAASGMRASSANLLNDAGQVAGTTNRYAGDVFIGRDSWFFDGATTRPIGLTGGPYTASTGLRLTNPSILTPGGLVAGYSRRYVNVDTPYGEDAWVFNGTTTRQVGLTGGVYAGSNGYQQTVLVHLVDGARAIGVSYRYTGSLTGNGQNAWYWTGSTTRLIGMTDAAHTGADGRQDSSVYQLNSSGKVAGTSKRYAANGTPNGLTAWYYDPTTNTTTPLVGATRFGDGYAESLVEILTDDGFAIGWYLIFTSPLDQGERRAFIFRPDRGMTDLGNLVSGGLTNNGWNTLRYARHASASGSFVGSGYVTGQNEGYSTFAMTLPDCPACAADYDLDGGVTGADVAAFFADFETGDACADVDQDGGVTGSDLGAFFAVFEAGGC